MKTWKENKNDEGFKEKTDVIGLRDSYANMPRSNQIGWVYLCVLGWIECRQEKGKKAGCHRQNPERV